MQRSEYLGVYHNTSESSNHEVPFRAAIKLRRKGKEDEWVNLGYMKSEAVAARVYNMYAIVFFGKGAILNEVQLTPDELIEFEAWLNHPDKPKRRETLAKARDRALALQAANVQFRKHTELRREQAQPQQQEIPGIV